MKKYKAYTIKPLKWKKYDCGYQSETILGIVNILDGEDGWYTFSESGYLRYDKLWKAKDAAQSWFQTILVHALQPLPQKGQP